MIVFIPINTVTGRPIGAKILRKNKVKYLYRDIDTKRFVSDKNFIPMIEAYKASLERKDQRPINLSVSANGYYSAYERQLIKLICNAELIGARTNESNVVWFKKRG